jgi:hypothetical protein
MSEYRSDADHRIMVQALEIERLRAELAEIKAQRPGLADAVVAQQKRAERAEAAIARVRELCSPGAKFVHVMLILGALGGES